MERNKNFDYDKAEADLEDIGVRHADDIFDYSRDKDLRDFMEEHDLNPKDYFKPVKKEDTSKKNDDPCYLTTACVKARNLPDHCMELDTLRSFRDDVLARRNGGKEEIENYYRIAPGIVEGINRRKDAADIWNRVYNELVAPCVSLIHSGQNEEAFQLYKSYSLNLGEKYKN